MRFGAVRTAVDPNRTITVSHSCWIKPSDENESDAKAAPKIIQGVSTLVVNSSTKLTSAIPQVTGVIVGNAIRLASEVESGDALG